MPPAPGAPLGSYEVTAKVRVGWDGRSRAGARHPPALKILFPRSVSIRLPERVPHKRYPMPVYEFTCRKCNKPFEVVRSIARYDPKKVRCPSCRSRRVERRWTSVFAVTSKKS